MLNKVYTPRFLNANTVLFAADSRICPICGEHMVRMVDERIGFFPNWTHNNQKAQMQRAGVVYESNVEHDGRFICEECVAIGKTEFQCKLCNEMKFTSKIQKSFGYPAEHLCTDCYETVSAKVWNDKCDELKEEHKYDLM